MRTIHKRNQKPPTVSKQVARARETAHFSKQLLSRHEIVALAGVTYPTIWKMIKRGDFPPARILGGRSMWVSTEIDAWLANLPVRRLKGDQAV